jgi:LacI family transcriptional regulator
MDHYRNIAHHWKGDGILTILYPHQTELHEFVRRAACHVVCLTADAGSSYPTVTLDNAAIGRMGAEHFLERGYRHFAFLKITDATDINDRLKGFRDIIDSQGLAVNELNWPREHATTADDTNWFDWICRRLRELPKPIGIMAQSDNRACHLVEACLRVGLHVPEEVAVIGVENNEFICDVSPVAITSIDSNREQLAYRAAELLGKLMNGESASLPTVVQPKGIVIRQSTNALAIDHLEVAAALKHIWEGFDKGITANDVVAVSRMSRCGLYHAFERRIGHSIGDEITRKRLEKAKALIRDSELKMHEIADMSGFSSAEHFSRAFTRLMKTTPTAYRRNVARESQSD